MATSRTSLGLRLLACGLLSCACGRPIDSKRRFPVGIYGVTAVQQLAQLKQLGFDSIQTSEGNPALLSHLANEAKRLSMDMVLYPDAVKGSTFSATARHWPVGGWYLVDEPDVANWSAERLAKLNAENKAWSPKQSTTFVIGQGLAAQRYGRIGDIVMLDWYPVPHLPLESVADQIDTAYQNMPLDKPLWAVLQAFDWRDAPQRDAGKVRIGRFPYFDEIRFMSYAAIVHNAKGIYYYTLSKPGGQTLFDVPEQFQALYRVASEMKAMQPILEQGKRVAPPFEIRATGLEAQGWHYRGRDYVIILNRRKDAMLRVPEELLDMKWRPLFETRRYTKELLTAAQGGWYLKPYQVMVFESRLHLFARHRAS